MCTGISFILLQITKTVTLTLKTIYKENVTNFTCSNISMGGVFVNFTLFNAL